MTISANVVSIADFRERDLPIVRADMLVHAETTDRRIELAALLVKAGLAGGRIHWTDTLNAAERRLTETTYRVHLLDLGADVEAAGPLLDAVLALPDRRTLLICRAAPPEIEQLRLRFPSAAIATDDELTVDWLGGQDSRRSPPSLAARRSGLEGLIEVAAELRGSVAGIGRQLAVADAELDAGKPLDGQIHLVAAMRRLSEVEERLEVMETDLRAHVDRNRSGRP